jgi:hypothetical protein
VSWIITGQANSCIYSLFRGYSLLKNLQHECRDMCILFGHQNTNVAPLFCPLAESASKPKWRSPLSFTKIRKVFCNSPAANYMYFVQLNIIKNGQIVAQNGHMVAYFCMQQLCTTCTGNQNSQLRLVL